MHLPSVQQTITTIHISGEFPLQTCTKPFTESSVQIHHTICGFIKYKVVTPWTGVDFTAECEYEVLERPLSFPQNLRLTPTLAPSTEGRCRERSPLLFH